MELLLLVDVDGVINARSSLRLPGETTPPTQWADLTQFSMSQNSVTLKTNSSPTVLNAISVLAEQVETFWFTDWFEDTHLFPEPDFPQLPFLGDSELLTDITDEWWKLTFLRENFLDRDIVWVDDSLSAEAGVSEWVHNQNGRVRTIQPNPRTGITETELNELHNMIGLP